MENVYPENDEKSESDFEDWPSAPPIDYLEQIKGYEMVSFETMIMPPPIQERN